MYYCRIAYCQEKMAHADPNTSCLTYHYRTTHSHHQRSISFVHIKRWQVLNMHCVLFLFFYHSINYMGFSFIVRYTLKFWTENKHILSIIIWVYFERSVNITETSTGRITRCNHNEGLVPSYNIRTLISGQCSTLNSKRHAWVIH